MKPGEMIMEKTYFLEERTKYEIIANRLKAELPEVCDLIKKEFEVEGFKIAIEFEEYFPKTFNSIFNDVFDDYNKWLESHNESADAQDAGNYLKREV
jgi:hypothetical protein